ncbi:MAG: hypothetical protein IH946_10830, partial [Bacteroidetes bacterium]|nr:hypothetical protein [Bacteroidota bacterium]
MRKFIVAVACYILAVTVSQGQEVEIIEKSFVAQDVSYYDIFKTHAAEYWIVGSKGTVRKIDDKGEVVDVGFKGTNNNLLKVDLIDSNNLIICGDKGTVIYHDLSTGKWETTMVPRFEKFCFYDICVVNTNEILICGGKSPIAMGKRT